MAKGQKEGKRRVIKQKSIQHRRTGKKESLEEFPGIPGKNDYLVNQTLKYTPKGKKENFKPQRGGDGGKSTRKNSRYMSHSGIPRGEQ